MAYSSKVQSITIMAGSMATCSQTVLEKELRILPLHQEVVGNDRDTGQA